jgi:hypothetical protein
MRLVPVLIAAACLALPASATKPTPDSPPTAPEELELAGAALVIQEHTYRFGDLLRSEPGTSVDACAAACHGEARCLAWSLTPPAYEEQARCELKTNAGAASYRPGAVSGISENLRMQPDMRYQVRVPEGYQPAPVEEELSGGPDEVAAIAPEALLGETETRITAVMQAPAAPEVETAAVANAPVEADAPAVPVVAEAEIEAPAAPIVFAVPAAPATPPGPPPPAEATAFAVPVKAAPKAPAAVKAPIILEPSRTALPPPAPSVKAEARAQVEAQAAPEAEAGS